MRRDMLTVCLLCRICVIKIEAGLSQDDVVVCHEKRYSR